MQSGNGLSQLATTSLSKRTRPLLHNALSKTEYGKEEALIEKLSAIDENMDTEEASKSGSGFDEGMELYRSCAVQRKR